jgi:3'(2'), 5'-bisphosphate nucleotidase
MSIVEEDEARMATEVAPESLTDAALALALAEAAGGRLRDVRSELTARGVEGAELKDAGDRAAQALLAELLSQARPGDAVLSEEATDDRTRLGAERVWIIDPLDGTREFSEAGRVDWAVHVALWERGDLVAGAVSLPAAGIAYGTEVPSVVPAFHGGALRLAVSRTRPPAFVAEVAAELGAELVPMGSAGVKVTSVLRGEADAYVHAGGQYEWDSAAPVAVARAAGLHTSRVDGSPLVYNREDPKLPDLLVCRPEHAAQILQAIKATQATQATQEVTP